MNSDKRWWLTFLASALCIVGALNWALVGLLRVNLIHRVLGRSSSFERAAYVAIGLSAAVRIVQVVAPMLVTAFAIDRAHAALQRGKHSIVGQRLPKLSGETLSGEHVALPDDIAGHVALLVMGFSYSSRWDVEAWAQAFHDRFGTFSDVLTYEIPVIGGFSRAIKPIITSGMRAGTPAADYNRVITIFGSVDTIRKSLGATRDTDTWVYLVGREGRVLFQCGGAWDEMLFRQVTATAETAIHSNRTREVVG